MESNLPDSCGRVTRSLRKRLTSVDSDNSSRPGTPISTKLTSISEISASPSKSIRNKRRSSISGIASPLKTPVKPIPAIDENSEKITPARRSTRRRSVSTAETETNSQSVVLKMPTFPAFDEENEQNVSKRITRSSSKSPQENKLAKTSLSPRKSKSPNNKINKEVNIESTDANITKRRRSGPKSVTSNHDECESDVEVKVLKIKIKDVKNTFFKNLTIDLGDKDMDKKNNEEKEENKLEENSTTKETGFEEAEQNNKKIVEETIAVSNIEIPEEQSNIQMESKPSENESLSNEIVNIDDRSKLSEDNKEDNVSDVQSSTELEIEFSSEKMTSDEGKTALPNSETVESNTDTDEKNILNESCTTPEMKICSSEKEEILNGNEDPNVNKATLKKVDFEGCSLSDDANVKNVYPRTPVSTKFSKRFQNDSSPDSEESFKAESNTPSDQKNANLKSEENTPEISKEAQLIDTGIQSSKCEDVLSADEINMNEYENNSPKSDTMEIEILNDNESTPSNRDKEELKWVNPSVKASTTDGTKLDMVEDNINTNEYDSYTGSVEKKRPKHRMSVIYSSEDERSETHEGEEENDDERNELEEHEEDTMMPKHDFHDDEAMEVDNYESGDSMESEERREIEENDVPVDFESIGSDTTENDPDECDEEEASEGSNSFIVSDNEELRFSETDIDNKIDGDDNEHTSKSKRKVYKRLQCQDESSSGSEEDVQKNFRSDSNNNKKDTIKIENTTDVNISCTSLSLENTVNAESKDMPMQSDTTSSEAVTQINTPNKLNKNTTPDSSEGDTEEREENNDSCKEILLNISHSDSLNKSVRDLSTEIDTSLIENTENENQSRFEEIREIYANKLSSNDENSTPDKIQSESILGEVSGSSESNGETDLENGERQQSFTMQVAVQDDEPKNVVSHESPKEPEPTSSSSNISENIMHMPLANPLIRTRRQSLTLPANPDMEICDSANRNSLETLIETDFNPHQSLIDTAELKKSKQSRMAEKRKRLSKSFCGASETHDKSIIDIDVWHINKRSKMESEDSVSDSQIDSIEEMNSTEKLPSKVSSTPYEKDNKTYSYSERILQRCDEILEAANNAKFESKTNNKKNKKSKKLKKRSKKKSVLNSSDETNTNDILRGISKKENRKDKTKTALSQAIKAADAILGKNKKPQQPKAEEPQLEEKSITEDVVESSSGDNARIKKKCKKEKVPTATHTSTTTAGIFMDLQQSPEQERKKATYIKLPTGTVNVEPATPKKRIVHASNGMEFKETPISPLAVGFKVQKIGTAKNTSSSSGPQLKKMSQDISSKKSQWTKSGLFKEENIHRPGTSKLLKSTNKTKKRQTEKAELNVNRNFKEMAMMRPDIKRGDKRDILLLKDRTQFLTYY